MSRNQQFFQSSPFFKFSSLTRISHTFFLRCIILFFAATLWGCIERDPIADDNTTNQPDLSGVWLPYATSPPGRLAPPLPALTEQGEALVSDYDKYYGTELPDPGVYCVAEGMPGVMTIIAGYPIEILQSEDRVTMIAEMKSQVRRVYLDGRAHPTDYPRTRMGYSIGYWENNSLIVDTQLLEAWPWRLSPRTQQTQIIERIYLSNQQTLNIEATGIAGGMPSINDDVLVDEITLIDSQLFPEPAKFTVYMKRVADDAILEYNCPLEVWQKALEDYYSEQEIQIEH